MNPNTLTLVCAKHGTTLEVGRQQVPGEVEVMPCPSCMEEAVQKGQEEYRDRFVLGHNEKLTYPKGLVQRLVSPSFGSIVSASEKLVRRSKTESRENKTNGHSSSVEIKYWARTTAKITGLFIGFRTLYDGDKEWWGEDTGYTFTARSHFRAALIVPSERENPVLVPLDSISAKV